MLQQILETMYIEPDLLAELDEEQKAVLFCKIREEQIRRYNEYDEKQKKLEKKNKQKHKKPAKNGKMLKFLEGSDGNPWTWVMGDHDKDRSINEIIEEEEQKMAAEQAAKEAEELARKIEKENERKAQEEQERLEDEKQKEEEELRKIAERRKQEEYDAYQSLKEAREAQAKLEEERKQKEEEQRKKQAEIEKRQKLRRRQSIDESNKLISRRTSEIYTSFKEARRKIEQLAEESSQGVEKDWKDRENKAKEADHHIRDLARRARQEHKRWKRVKTESMVIGIVNKMSLDSTGSNRFIGKGPAPLPPHSRPPVEERLRPAKPPNRQAIIQWFKEVELPKGSGLDPKTQQVAEWFHGIITRERAEELLEGRMPGTFLVRVSERVWGYCISYMSTDKCKHFLIDTSGNRFQFFGSNQIGHSNLSELIKFHKEQAISGLGREYLLYPCPQTCDPPDHSELFDDIEGVSVKL